jgi:biotin carboxyl carrier protein
MTRHRSSLVTTLFAAMVPALALGGCATANPSAPAPTQSSDTVAVTKRDLAPVVSLTGTVVANATYWTGAPVAGSVQIASSIGVGRTVRAGDLLASIGGNQLTAPTSGTVAAVAVASGADVPKRFPLVSLTYSGYAISGTIASSLSWMMLANPTTGRGQIPDGPAPFDCSAVVPAADTSPSVSPPASSAGDGASATADGAAAQSGSTSPSDLLCLIPKDVDSVAGAQAITVIASTTVKDATTVPLTAVAGRRGTGEVTVVEGAERRRTTVKLGQSDGQYIEIRSGLRPGQQVGATAPNLTEKSLR